MRIRSPAVRLFNKSTFLRKAFDYLYQYTIMELWLNLKVFCRKKKKQRNHSKKSFTQITTRPTAHIIVHHCMHLKDLKCTNIKHNFCWPFPCLVKPSPDNVDRL